MTDPVLDVVSDVAEAYYRRLDEVEAAAADYPVQMFYDTDPVVRQMRLESLPHGLMDECERLSSALLEDEEIGLLRSESHFHEAQTAGGFAGIPVERIGLAIFSSALAKRFLLRKPEDAASLAALMLQNVHELRQALQGTPTTSLCCYGFAGATLDAETSIPTPWGTLSAAPEVDDGAVRTSASVAHGAATDETSSDARSLRCQQQDRDVEWHHPCGTPPQR